MVVARRPTVSADPGGTVLVPATYAGAAQDPFAFEHVEHDIGRLWEGLDSISSGDLDALRALVEERNERRGQLAAFCGLAAGLEPAARPLPLLEAAGMLAAQTADRLARVQRVADDLHLRMTAGD